MSGLDLGYPADARLVDPAEFESFPAAFQATVDRFPGALAMRTADDSVRWTWGEVAREVETLASGLTALGLVHGDTLAIMMTNRAEHQLIDLAAMHLGVTTTSIYTSLTAGEVSYVLEDSGAKIAVIESGFDDVVREAMEVKSAVATTVVVIGGDAALSIGDAAVVQYDELKLLKPPADYDFKAAWNAVGRDDLVVLVYTSGTTGPPKGVELSHGNLLWTVAGYREVVSLAPGGRLLSAFPLAHLAERVATHYMPIVQGHCVTHCPDIRRLNEYYMKVRPAYVFLTPRSLDRFRAKIEHAIATSVTTTLQHDRRRAIELGLQVVGLEQNGVDVPAGLMREWTDLEDVRTGLLELVGLDQVEYTGVGGAPVPDELLRYFLALGLPAMEGWGLTETGTCSSHTRRGDVRVGYAGRLFPSVELKVMDDGELLVRGPQCTRGYRNKPEQSRELIDEDGWLHTGDVGELTDDGFLKLGERKKEIIISANGKNMSPSRIESEIKAAGPLVGHVAVIGDGRPYIVAIMTLDPEGLAQFRGAQPDRVESDQDALTLDPRLESVLQGQIDAANSRLSGPEQIRRWTVLDGDWFPGGDELTPTMKLRRKPISAKYAQQIERLYESER